MRFSQNSCLPDNYLRRTPILNLMKFYQTVQWLVLNVQWTPEGYGQQRTPKYKYLLVFVRNRLTLCQNKHVSSWIRFRNVMLKKKYQNSWSFCRCTNVRTVLGTGMCESARRYNSIHSVTGKINALHALSYFRTNCRETSTFSVLWPTKCFTFTYN